MVPVDQWDPSATLSERHRRILNLAWSQMDAPNLGLADSDLGVLRPIMSLGRGAWETFVAPEPTRVLVNWIKVLTRLERDCAGFECGSRSPVLPLLSMLKARGELPEDLHGWIKANTTNRFLPYGSLLDRL